MLFLSIFQTVISNWSNAMTHNKMFEQLVNPKTQLLTRRSLIIRQKAVNIRLANIQPSLTDNIDKECCNE